MLIETPPKGFAYRLNRAAFAARSFLCAFQYFPYSRTVSNMAATFSYFTWLRPEPVMKMKPPPGAQSGSNSSRYFTMDFSIFSRVVS